MNYRDSTGKIDTPKKILKVDHAGEFGAVNIYKSQIFVSKLLGRDYVPMLEKFVEDEKKHMEIFWDEINRRNGIKCKSYWLCGLVAISWDSFRRYWVKKELWLAPGLSSQSLQVI